MAGKQKQKSGIRVEGGVGRVQIRGDLCDVFFGGLRSARAVDSHRLNLNGVHINAGGDVLAATDGHRLHLQRVKLEGGGDLRGGAMYGMDKRAKTCHEVNGEECPDYNRIFMRTGRPCGRTVVRHESMGWLADFTAAAAKRLKAETGKPDPCVLFAAGGYAFTMNAFYLSDAINFIAGDEGADMEVIYALRSSHEAVAFRSANRLAIVMPVRNGADCGGPSYAAGERVYIPAEVARGEPAAEWKVDWGVFWSLHVGGGKDGGEDKFERRSAPAGDEDMAFYEFMSALSVGMKDRCAVLISRFGGKGYLGKGKEREDRVRILCEVVQKSADKALCLSLLKGLLTPVELGKVRGAIYQNYLAGEKTLAGLKAGVAAGMEVNAHYGGLTPLQHVVQWQDDVKFFRAKKAEELRAEFYAEKWRAIRWLVEEMGAKIGLRSEGGVETEDFARGRGVERNVSSFAGAGSLTRWLREKEDAVSAARNLRYEDGFWDVVVQSRPDETESAILSALKKFAASEMAAHGEFDADWCSFGGETLLAWCLGARGEGRGNGRAKYPKIVAWLFERGADPMKVLFLRERYSRDVNKISVLDLAYGGKESREVFLLLEGVVGRFGMGGRKVA